jgi:hypothetical protein
MAAYDFYVENLSWEVAETSYFGLRVPLFTSVPPRKFREATLK